MRVKASTLQLIAAASLFLSSATAATDEVDERIGGGNLRAPPPRAAVPRSDAFEASSASTMSDDIEIRVPPHGRRAPEKRIIGGQRANLDAFPWYAQTRGCRRIPDTENELDCCEGQSRGYCPGGCGAILISKRHVLTAGHCVIGGGTENFQIRGFMVGEVCRSSDNCDRPSEFAAVQSWRVHDDYGLVDVMPTNDVALITLSKDVESISPVYVDTGDLLERIRERDAHPELIAVGHGFVRPSNYVIRLSKYLQEGSFTLLDDSVCGSLYSSEYLADTMLCAGQRSSSETKVSTCNGDSGGPLLSMDARANSDAGGAKEPALVAITSWGPLSCTGGIKEPSVFAEVGMMVDFFGPLTCDFFAFGEDRPEWCGVCEKKSNRPTWCAWVTPPKEEPQTQTNGAQNAQTSGTVQPQRAKATTTTTTVTTAAARATPDPKATARPPAVSAEESKANCERERSLTYCSKNREACTCAWLANKKSANNRRRACQRNPASFDVCENTCMGRCSAS